MKGAGADDRAGSRSVANTTELVNLREVWKEERFRKLVQRAGTKQLYHLY